MKLSVLIYFAHVAFFRLVKIRRGGAVPRMLRTIAAWRLERRGRLPVQWQADASPNRSYHGLRYGILVLFLRISAGKGRGPNLPITAALIRRYRVAAEGKSLASRLKFILI